MTEAGNRQKDPRRRLMRVARGVAAVLGAMMIVPASGLAATKFGADLSGHPEPSYGNEWCPGGAAVNEFHVPCTRVPLQYGEIGYAGTSPFAPEDGVIDKIRLIASVDGEFRLQLVKTKWLGPAQTEINVVTKGPKIEVAGTDDIESFDVDVPVNEHEWLAMKTARISAMSCEPGINSEAIADPALAVPDPFSAANYHTGCTHLVQAVME